MDGAIVGFASTVAKFGLLHATEADMQLLRVVHEGLGYQSPATTNALKKVKNFLDPDHIVNEGDRAAWPETIWSDSNQDAVRAAAATVSEEVAKNAREVARHIQNLGHRFETREDIKTHLVDMFVCVFQGFFSLPTLDAATAAFSQNLPDATPNGGDLRAHLESPLPATGSLSSMDPGSEDECLENLARIIADVRVRFGLSPSYVKSKL